MDPSPASSDRSPYPSFRTPPALQRQIETEQLRMVWGHARIGVLVATAFAVVLAVALRGIVASTAIVDAWLAVKLTVSGFRTAQGLRFVRLSNPDRAWTRYTLAALMLDSGVWGAAGFYVILTAPWPMASFISAVMACLACVATFGLQVSARFTAAYVGPILLPAMLALLLRHELYGQLGGLGMAMLLGLQLATAARSQKRVEEGIQLRLRAEDLAHEKAEALKIAVRQGAVRTQFLANISHELRTPLHGILGMARLLQSALKDDPALLQRAELISSSGSHLLALINDLLDLSRIDAGQFIIRKERHDLSAQVAQLAGIYAMRCNDKDLHFTLLNTLPECCWVTGDPARFRQVLHNLLGNAVKFTQRGGVTLAVGRNAATGLARIEVHDTGPGIPSTDLDKIFEAFHQSDGGMAALSSEGAGLGLTIARDIARAMGGDIIAASISGGGTTMIFTASLPDAEVPALDAAPDAAKSTALDGAADAAKTPAMSAVTIATATHLDAEPAASLQKNGHADGMGHAAAAGLTEHADASATPDPAACGTLADEPASEPADSTPDRCLALLAEDNDINALVATNFLEIIGVEAERVKDGQEAVREALRSGPQQRRRPDLILMDCQMPVMTGHEAARMIRAKEQAMGLARIPIVALTATASDTERQDCLDAGMDDFLSKPCTLEDLSRAIERWSPVPPAGSTVANVVCITQPPGSGSAAQATQAAQPGTTTAPPLDGNPPPHPKPGGASLRA